MWPQQRGDFAGQPVVGEKKVIAHGLAVGEIEDLVGERRHLVVQRVLVQLTSRRQVDDARVGRQRFESRVARSTPGEDVGGDAALAESGAHLPYVYVEPAVRALAERGRGG